ncbi:hypothetical protein [Endozoicomonas sp. YOMI1]|uniref:hypothetical protein n=1 Tax=Endozoicomonas sp. YOMI1 TaxID=2828739 RepID=UPI0021498A60|nr:hypothetical protein [Endozoicomonas sp. YOMI1]
MKAMQIGFQALCSNGSGDVDTFMLNGSSWIWTIDGRLAISGLLWQGACRVINTTCLARKTWIHKVNQLFNLI